MPTIDERIVEMQFDNRDFEKGVDQSIKSLDALKKSLNFEDSYDSLDKFAKTVNKTDLSGIKKSIDEIKKHFTPLGRFVDRHIDGIIKSVEKKIAGSLKSITFDQVGEGFNKYAKQTKAVQAITNATGKSVDEVERVLEKLMKYTDETSYDFTEMASTIGKFTSVGVELSTAEKAMEGIANEAAISGAGIQEANRAMYNFAQALSTGKVQLIDWKSIENANMATKEFKEELIKTAIELGTVKKVTDTTGKTAKGTAVDFTTFNSTLKDSWLTSEVLIKTLERYADKDGPIDSVGYRAYIAAQRALTFEDALKAVQDAVSSQWMISFKYMFGDLNESMDLWTDFCNAVIEVTSAIGEWRNELLKGWHILGGYNAMLETASNFWGAFVGILNMVHDAFANVFPPLTVENLISATEYVEKATASWKEMFGYIGEQEVETEIEVVKNSAEDLADALERGVKGDKVKALQDQLIKAGYKLDKYGADGVYGPETQAAVKKLQADLGIDQTGMWDETTKAATVASKKFVEIGKATEIVSKSFGDTVIVEETWRRTTDYAKQLTNTLKEGSKGRQVKTLQDQLVRLGYLDEAQADAIYGEKTEEAVKKLQEDLGVEVTGIWDEATKAATEAEKTFVVNEKGTMNVAKHVGAYGDVMERFNTLVQGGASTVHILTSVIGFLGKSLGVVLNTLSPLLDAGLTILSVVSQCITNFDSFLEEIGLFDAALNVLETVLSPIKEELQGFADAIYDFFNANPEIDSFSKLFSNLNEEFQNSSIGQKLTEWKKKINEFLLGIGVNLPGIISNITGTFKAFTGFFGDLVAGRVSFKTFGVAWSKLAGRLRRSGTSMGKTIAGTMTKMQAKFGKTLPVITKKLDEFSVKASEWISQKFQNGITWLGENLPKAFSWFSEKLPKVTSAIGNFSALIKGKITERFKTVSDWFRNNGAGIISTAQEIGSALAEFFGLKGANDDGSEKGLTFIERFAKFWDNLKGKLKEIYENSPLLQGVWNTIKPFIDKITGLFNNINLQPIRDFFDTLITCITNFFNWSEEDTDSTDPLEPIEKLQERLKAFEPMKESLKTLAESIKNSFKEIYKSSPTLQKAWNIIEPITNRVKDFFEKFDTKNISDFFDTLKQGLNDFFTFSAKAEGSENTGEDTLSPIERLKERINVLKPIVEDFQKLMEAINTAWNSGETTLSEINSELSDSSIISSISGIVNAAVEEGKKIPFATVGKVLMSAIGVYAVAKIAKGIGNLGKGILNFGKGALSVASVFESFIGGSTISGIVDQFSSSIGNSLSKASSAVPKESFGNTMLKSLGSVALAAVSITGSLYLLSTIDIDKAKEGLIAFVEMVGSLVGSFLLLNWLGGDIKSIGYGMLALSASVGVLALSIEKMMSILEENDESDVDHAFEIIKSFLRQLALIEGGLTLAGKGKTFNISGILQLCGGVYLLVLAVGRLTNIFSKVDSSNAADKAVDTVARFLDKLGKIEIAIAAVTSKTGFSIIKIDGVLSMCLGILALSFAMDRIATGIGKHGEKYDTAVYTVERLLTNLGSIQTKIALVSSGQLEIHGILSMCGGIYLLALAMDKIAAGLGGKNARNYENAFNTVEALITTIGFASGSLGTAIMSLAVIPWYAGIKAIANMAEFLIGFAGLGALFTWADNSLLGGALTTGMSNLAYAIGNSIGTFIQQIQNPGGKSVEASKDIVTDIQDLTGKFSAVIDAIKPFLEKAKDIKLEHAAGVKNLSKILIDLTATNLLDSLSAFVDKGTTGESSGSGFVDAIQNMQLAVQPLQEFSEGIANVNAGNITTFGVPAFNALKELGDAVVAIAWDNVKTHVLSFFSGDTNVYTFLADMILMAPMLKIFSALVSGIDANSVSTAAGLLQSLGTAADSVPKVNGIFQTMFGESNVETFGNQLYGLGMGLYKFYLISNYIPNDFSPTGAINTLGALAELQGKVQLANGLLQGAIGSRSLETFGSELKALGTGLYDFYSSTKDISSDFTASGPLAVLTALSDLESDLEAHEGLKQWIIGDKSLKEFGEGIRQVGIDLFSFNLSTAFVNTAKLNEIATTLSNLAAAVYQGGNGAFVAESVGSFQTMFYRLAGLDYSPLIEVGTQITTNVVSGLDQADPSLPTALQTMMETASTNVSDTSSNFQEAVGTILTAMSNKIKNNTTISTAFGSMMAAAVRGVTEKRKLFVAAGIFITLGLAKGIGDSGAVAKVKEAARQAVMEAKSAAEQASEENSPSKVFAKIGQYMTLGMAVGMEKYASVVKSAAVTSVEDSVAGAKEAMKSFSSLILEDIDDTPVIRPVLDLSDVAAGASSLGGLFGSQTVGLRSTVMANKIADARVVSDTIRIEQGEKLGINSSIEALNSRIDQLSYAISNMKVVTETGAIIGAIAPGMDKALGKRASRADRGG